MSETIEFFVQCDPVAHARPRMATRDKWGVPLSRPRQYNTTKTKAMRNAMALAAHRHKPSKPLEGPIELHMVVFGARPKSCPKKRWAWTVKPDLDNFIKLIDAFNGILWVDDNQIIEIVAKKEYSEKPGFYFCVSEVTKCTS